MSVGSLAGQIAASAAGTSLAQANGPDKEQAQHLANVRKSTVDSQFKAEAAAGIGETDTDDTRSNERDADGRRLWEKVQKRRRREEGEDPPPSKDATGQCGSMLDISG